mmetsp:Transcript_17264/g.47481  ORF Transcript_17264/g.47481 Transcript_17264/m.47481 type:complete len:180 (+) Transcript_17264:883-1422(+)
MFQGYHQPGHDCENQNGRYTPSRTSPQPPSPSGLSYPSDYETSYTRGSDFRNFGTNVQSSFGSSPANYNLVGNVPQQGCGSFGFSGQNVQGSGPFCSNGPQQSFSQPDQDRAGKAQVSRLKQQLRQSQGELDEIQQQLAAKTAELAEAQGWNSELESKLENAQDFGKLGWLRLHYKMKS